MSWNPPVLQTERLLLRPVTESDAQSIFDYAKNPAVSRYTLWEPHSSSADTLKYIQDYVFKHYADHTPDPWAITFKNHPDKVIGTIGCHWVSKEKKCMELAYALAEDQWGKGLVVEAGKAVLDYCTKEYSLKRIQAHYKTENAASGRVMEKLGMKFERTEPEAIFHRGKNWDVTFYAKDNINSGHNLIKDLLRSFLVPTLIGKSFVLYFGLNYSEHPGEGYGYGLAAAIAVTLTSLLLFVWKHRNYED